MYYKNKYTDKIIEEEKEVKYGDSSNYNFRGVIDKIIWEIAKEEGMQVGEVRRIIGSVFRFTHAILSRIKKGFFGALSETDNLPIIKYKYIGKFQPSAYRIKKMLSALEKKRKKDNAEHRQE